MFKPYGIEKRKLGYAVVSSLTKKEAMFYLGGKTAQSKAFADMLNVAFNEGVEFWKSKQAKK